mmetsp:Transcript_46411/g.121825  ORF Transcript_46411/g.121825 Transcript_46411/m.121825 type:complete len:185 (+) Transcript_46411:19-573(+)|eukprot:CAMPEP_0115847214 /NCGR_PEP_ID=MMETSP0287-20121206/10268_1 /TAXON_ID=412157 /ORGANISM="Chrysochromulina rotalis, Strain UIO044" /LENGTH=184 /DNA_ID=CAMNT_0003301043 /DNA_START=13 /DNA_END=567 /DNA_ORIENTATION=-
MGACGSKSVPDEPSDAPPSTGSATGPRVGPSSIDPVTPERAVSKPELVSSLSVRSLNTVNTLTTLEREMQDMRDLSKSAAGHIDAVRAGTAGLPASLRGDLCNLHGSANKMLATRIDAIMTTELVSGKDEARAKRKQLVQQAEQLIEMVEGQVKAIDGLKGSHEGGNTGAETCLEQQQDLREHV